MVAGLYGHRCGLYLSAGPTWIMFGLITSIAGSEAPGMSRYGAFRVLVEDQSGGMPGFRGSLAGWGRLLSFTFVVVAGCSPL